MTGVRPRLTAAGTAIRPVPGRLQEEYRRYGYVTDLTMSALPGRAARLWPSRSALVQADRELTYQELLGLVERAAGWLAGTGAGPGNVVCWQTPNWWEAHVLGLAIWHAGAVSCPVVPVYREHELRQIIGQVRPAVVIAAGEFRGFKHAEAFDELLDEAGLDGAARVILRGSRPRWTPFDEVVAAAKAHRLQLPHLYDETNSVGGNTGLQGAIHPRVGLQQRAAQEIGSIMKEEGVAGMPLGVDVAETSVFS